MCFQLTRSRGAEADHAVHVRIAGDHFRVLEMEACPQGLLELGAGAERVIDPERDQTFGDRGRDQPLCGLARDVELARQLVLGVARDEVEPRRPDRQIAPSVLRPGAGGLLCVGSIGHGPRP